MSTHPHRDGKHVDASTMGHLHHTLDRISNVVTADLIVDFFILVTGVILVVLELGVLPHRPFDDHSDPRYHVKVVRDKDASGH